MLLSRRKEFGGLGIPNMRDFNMALLASWGKRFFSDSEGEWKKIIAHKYDINSPNILWSQGSNGSTFWKSVTWALSAAKNFYRWKLGNGEKKSAFGMMYGVGIVP